MWLLLLVFATIGLSGSGPQASAETLAGAAVSQTIVGAFPADADTRVHEASPTTNYGSRIVLRVDGASDLDIESYLRFTVSGVAGSVQRATLRLHATADTADGPTVSGTSNDWAEMAVTWSTRPAPTTAAVDDEGAVAIDSWVELDVTPLVSTDGTFSFVLAATSSDGVDFDSRESTSTSLRPELVVEALTTGAPVATSPPTISGIPREGETLTASSGTWSGSQPITLANQWQRCDSSGAGCTDLANETGQTYALTQSDVGATLRVVVTATNAVGSGTASSAPTSPVIGAGDVVIAAAGDIAGCSQVVDEATAQLLDSIAPSAVLTLGDNVYPDGTDSQFTSCYDPTWGRHKAKILPSVGNHEYHTPGASGYFNYFGAAAGDPAKGYYAFDLGAWRFYALNSNCAQVSCAAGDPQEQWLRADLAAHPRTCTAAFMHHPRFASGHTSGRRDNPSMGALFQAFYDASGDLWLVGHNHQYERLTRLAPTGAIDLERGVLTFVAGTGGAGLYAFGPPITGSEVRSATHGVLKLTLREGGYDWAFVPVAGATFTDAGSDVCSAAPPDTTPPSAPTNLVSTTASAGSVGLSWAASTDNVGVVGYDVYRDAQLLASTAETSHTDTSAVAGVTYEYHVTARDAAGNDSGPSNTVTVTVNGANEPSITSDGGGDTASVSAAENGIAATDVDATDPNAGDTLTYSISGGTDQAAFSIDSGSGVLTFASAPDYEAPTDVGANNVYDVTVQVSDGNGGSDSQAIAVTVTNENEFSPVITSDGGNPTADLSRPESQNAVTDVDATDGDGDILTYAISGGADETAFVIVPSTGVLSFVVAPNFEAPTDLGADNTYEVIVGASDGSFSDTQTITVAVTDVAEDAGSPLYFSLFDPATVGGVAAENEDVLFFDGTNFSLTFDGSDAGIEAFRIDAFSWLDATSLLLSFDTAGAVPGIAGTFDDSDIVRFTSTLLGDVTAGTFSVYFDGSDVGLTTSGEDVDAVELLPNGHILVSTLNTVAVTGAAGEDEDLLEFVPTTLGANTTGTFSLYFDGSDVGLTTSGEDVDAAAVDASGTIYLSTFNNFSVPGASGQDEDVFVFNPTSTGSTTAGSYLQALYFDGSGFGLGANDLFAIDLP